MFTCMYSKYFKMKHVRIVKMKTGRGIEEMILKEIYTYRIKDLSFRI